MEQQILNIGKHQCIHYFTADSADMLLVQPVDEHDLENMDSQLEHLLQHTDRRFELVAIKVADWQSELTPWSAPPVFGKQPFGNGAASTLQFIICDLLPAMNVPHVLLGGYSLAGLFSLWAAYNSNVFEGIAAVSPSVWYPQWIDYAEQHTAQTQTIYLSLGNQEEHTRNKVMAGVGNNIRHQHRLLKEQTSETVLEWNEGNHFSDAHLRMAKGFEWLLNSLPQSR